ncbi:MAG: HlyD family type I secretion periplasmic adaptor subunit [Pseudomonadota bacterium]
MSGDLLPRCSSLADTRTGFGARGLILMLAALFASLVGWAAWATVEQVVSATGKVEPVDEVQVVNHPRGGRISDVVVREGDAVAAGAVLLRLDGTLETSALEEMQARLQVEQALIARLEAELEDRGLGVPAELARDRPDLVAEASALLEARKEAHARQLAQLATTERKRALELAERDAEIRRLESTLALMKQEFAALDKLAAQGLAPRLRHLAIERQLRDLEGELAVAKSAAESAGAARDETRDARARHVADRTRDLRAELSLARAKAEDLAQAARRQRQVVAELAVTAPVAGIVKDVSATQAGQSFAAYAPLMTLVPTDGPLVIEAQVTQQDIGRLHVGQQAVVKVMAYDYLRYGRLGGEVQRIAADASADEQSGELTYRVDVEPSSTTLNRDGVDHPLVPGMLVDVELISGERSILSFLTDRIIHLKDDAFREG